MIRYFDMFAGVGGFRAGLGLAGGFECIGHCEIDKYADASYRAIHKPKESEVFYTDARTIDPKWMPSFDMLCAGFPCQSFSNAGKREGFADPRGTLFFEIARLAGERRPSYLLLENVPGLLSHDKGRTFATILATLCDLGYCVEWQVLNSKDYGVPQSRRRLFLIGYLDHRCAGKVFPVRDSNAKALIQLLRGRQGGRVYDPKGLACTLTSDSGGMGGKTGLYFIDFTRGAPQLTAQARCLTARYNRGMSNRKGESSGVLLIKEATKKGYAEARPGDGVTIGFAGSNTRRGRVGKGMSHTLDTCRSQGVMTISGRIRKLMPRECFRLQGFSEDQIDCVLDTVSDSQAYKQAGNSVTVNVICALGMRIRAMHEGLNGGDKPLKQP